MKTVEQIIIAAGGKGTRMSSHLNTLNSKPLMKIGDTFILNILIKWSILGGIKNFCISYNEQNFSEIKNIVKKYKEVKFELRLTGKTFQEVPKVFEDVLQDRFIFVGGHTPITVKTIKEMLRESIKNRYVISIFENKTNKIQKKERILFSKKNKKLELVYENDFLPEDHFYIKNPYIIDKEIVTRCGEDGFKKTPLFYIFSSWKNNKSSVGYVENEVPVEFNTDYEFERSRHKILYLMNHY